MLAKKLERTPVRVAPREVFIAEKRSIVAEYERRYEMSSAEMAALVDGDAIVPTIEMMTWYQAYDVLQFLIETTPTTATPGITTETFMTAARSSILL